jgi:hypothetical protein
MRIIKFGNNSVEIPDDYKDLGWVNGWQGKPFPKEYIRCGNLNHKIKETQLSSRGSDYVSVCDICKIYWQLDCSD